MSGRVWECIIDWKYPVRVVVIRDAVDTVEKLTFEKSKFLGNVNLIEVSDTNKINSHKLESSDSLQEIPEVCKDLKLYFSGVKIDFLKYNVNMSNLSNFTRSVLNEVRKIPYKKTVTYKDVAKKLKTSPRAVGQALKKNPTPIIIPCHRVIGKNSIGGFSQGVEIKLELLRLEGLDF